jgi:hypothetical protein
MTETVDDTASTEAAFKHVSDLLKEARLKAAPAKPWHEHAAFDEIDAARWQATRARDALAGIAALLQPDSREGNEQLNMARRAVAYAVFDFFAEVLRAPLDAIDSASNRLQKDLHAAQL